MKHQAFVALAMGLSISTLSACAVLHERPGEANPTQAWAVVQKTASVEVLVRQSASPATLEAPRLGAVRITGSVAPDDAAEVDEIGNALAASLRASLKPPRDGAPTLNVTLSELTPVSPALNIASALLVFYPLDSGGATVEAELVDSAGERIALWRERLTGGLGLTGSLSRWVKVKNALIAWGEVCVTQPPWMPPVKSAAL
ncbi:hypothetical protein [Niveibacterium microcysteis]|uniref:Lipoprotein n=1 Tax=Niveibacterium microcysteis TaxID=2811415 RepID=A0ABX7M1C8_9RHOO|nr:hypothetical protein [Niveibacterium microcysteis]QSI75221.1 hypothetical protein JY500_11865 [Niveibacterium microcysteis]